MLPRSGLIALVCVCLVSAQGVAADDTEGRHVQRTYVHTPLLAGAAIDDDGHKIGSTTYIAFDEGEYHVDVTVTDASGLPVLVRWVAHVSDSFIVGHICGNGSIDFTDQMRSIWFDLPHAIDTAGDALEGDCGDPVTTATTGTIDIWIS